MYVYTAVKSQKAVSADTAIGFAEHYRTNFQQTRDIHTMLFQCWPTIFDAGPTLKQYCVNGSCLLVRYRPDQVDMIGSYDDILTYGVKKGLAQQTRCINSMLD